jgi:hypothetical protein
MTPQLPHLPLAIAIAAATLAGGCISQPSNPAPGHSAIDIDPKLATGDYWYHQPPSVTITGRDFDKLVAATEEVARSRFFIIDRTDYRDGLITTKPLVSRQFFEPWRSDTSTAFDLAQSSLQTIRRTLHFEIARRGDNTWTMSPKVLVERYVLIGRSLTSPANMQVNVFAPSTESGYDADPGIVPLANTYWYALGRDANLEKDLAEDVKKRL